MKEVDMRDINALLWLIVRERTHPECPPEKRFVSRFEGIPGEWETREDAQVAVMAWIRANTQPEGK